MSKLELKPVDDDQYETVDVPLSLASIAEFHAEMEALVEKYVAKQAELYPGIPREVHRQLVRGQCLCARAQFVLRQS